jgi:phage virion morphogenesis protein
MEPRIDFEDERARQLMERLSLAGKLRPAANEIGRTLKTSTQMRFRTQTAPDGSRWVPSKRAIREGGQTLSKTRLLRNSINYEASSSEVLVGTNKIYAPPLHFGFSGTQNYRAHDRQVTQVFGHKLDAPLTVRISAGSRNINLPARPIVGFSSQDRTDILDILREHVERQTHGTA